MRTQYSNYILNLLARNTNQLYYGDNLGHDESVDLLSAVQLKSSNVIFSDGWHVMAQIRGIDMVPRHFWLRHQELAAETNLMAYL